MNAVELFAGGGGLLLGCSLAGFTHEAAVEWNGDACDTLRLNCEQHYPFIEGMRVIEGDIRDVDWGFVPHDVDLLAGGPPCQPFSLGGLARAALDWRDMFPVMTSVLARLRPKAFVVENVKGLTRASFSDYYSYILLRLQHPTLCACEDESWRDHLARLQKEHSCGIHDALRYEVIPTVIDAADYGVAQHRHRVIIVGFRSNVQADWSFPLPTHSGCALYKAQVEGGYWERHKVPRELRARPTFRPTGDGHLLPWITVRDALAGMPEPKADSTPGWLNHAFQPGAKAYPGHTGSLMDEPSKAIKAGVHGVPGGENMLRYPDGTLRYYSVREAARIQSFPDQYEFSGSWTEAMRQIGNAVPVRLARIVASSVAAALLRDEERRTLDHTIDGVLLEEGLHEPAVLV